jgi:peptide/nickel transport system permease protein
MTEVDILPATAHTPLRRSPQRGYWRNVLRRFRRDRVGLVCLIVLLAIALAAIFAPLLAPADPYRTSMIRRLIAPGERGYLLGTDELGRDMVSRLLYGGRVSLSMGIAPIVLATMIGGGLGVIAGYFGRHVNMIIMRVIDVFYAFPSVLLAVAMAGVLGSGILNSLISLTLVFIPPIARVAESVTTQVRNQDFVEAARATGAGSTRIIIEHVLANVTGPILTYASSLVSVSIIIASGLSFLGLGAAPPTADWGLMLNTLRQAVYVAPVNAVLPGVMIFLTSVSFNLVSDSLRTAMDVRA